MSELLQTLREATACLHRELERHALMQRILAGALPVGQYSLYLRNLHPIYASLERALATAGGNPSLAAFAHPALFRTAAIERDLLALAGPTWRSLPLVPSARDYARSLRELADAQPALIGAHAYVRYLGDLSGGLVVRSRVAAALSLDVMSEQVDGLAFYSFDAPAGVLARRMREDLQSLALSPGDAGEFVAAAVAGFERHREIFDELESSPPQSLPLN